MSTKTALEKLTKKQMDTLDLYAFMMNVYEKKQNKEYRRGYAGLLDGYLAALEDMEIINLTERRLLRAYFIDITKEEAQNHHE